MPLAVIAIIAAVLAAVAAIAGSIVQFQAQQAAAKTARDVRDARVKAIADEQAVAAQQLFTARQQELRETAGDVFEARVQGQIARGQAQNLGLSDRSTSRLLAEARQGEQRLIDPALTNLQFANIRSAQDLDHNATLAQANIDVLNAQTIRKPSAVALSINILGGAALIGGVGLPGKGKVGAVGSQQGAFRTPDPIPRAATSP
jgi:ABC-type Na+ efflux pump permease subunit